MSTSILLHHDGRWLAFDGGSLTTLPARPRLETPTVVISDFDGAVSSVVSLEGSTTHAVALIERKLRADGLIDNESKILVHKTKTVGKGYQALFTAVPLEAWQQLFSWAQGQDDHCLLIPSAAMLWQAIKPGRGIVLQVGRQVIFLGALRDRIVHASALAFSEQFDDLQITVNALANRVGEELSSADDVLESFTVDWCSALTRQPDDGAAWADQALLDIFAARSGASVRLLPQTTVTDADGVTYRSSLPQLAAHTPALIAVNPPLNRAMFLAERTLIWASAASLLLAIGLAFIGGRWALATYQANQHADQLGTEIEQTTQATSALQAQQVVPDAYSKVIAFIEQADTLERAAHPQANLIMLQHAAARQVRILRLRLEEVDAKKVLRVDGQVVPGAGETDGGARIARFVERLRAAGFTPVAVDPEGSEAAGSPAGFFSYRLLPTVSVGAAPTAPGAAS